MDSLTGERNLAVDTAIRTEHGRLLKFIRGRVRTEQDAEDILQDVFFQLLSSYSVTEPIEQLTSWLFRVARNKIIDWYRRRRHGLAPRPEEDEDLAANLEEIVADHAEIPDQLFTRSMVWSELSEALEDLPDKQREVFLMHEIDGRSFKEIAELTGEPLNTLLSRKRYAVLFLRERLQELYNDMENL